MIRIVTDSCSDLPPGVAEHRGITVLPLGVTVGEESYRDGLDLSPRELYDLMRAGKVVPKTSQVPIGLLIDTFSASLARGEQPIYISLSSRLSGTHQTALLAAEHCPGAVVIDTKGASMGEGLTVLYAQGLVDQGRSHAEVVQLAREHAARMEHIFMVDSLESLHRGGRISGTKALVGSLLSIKPILHFEDGAIQPLENTRARKRAFARMAEIMAERAVKPLDQVIAITHGDDLEGATMLRDIVQQAVGFGDCIISTVGATIGAHSGPGTMALFFLSRGQGGTQA